MGRHYERNRLHFRGVGTRPDDVFRITSAADETLLAAHLIHSLTLLIQTIMNKRTLNKRTLQAVQRNIS